MPITNHNVARVISLIEKHNKQYKVPAVTLVARNHHSPWHVLISTIISLRTKDEVTWKAAERLFKKANSPQETLKLTEKQIQELIYPAGFYKTKAKTIKELAKTILEDYNNVVPDEIDELVKMKGVGRKTANLVLIEGYGKHAMCVDTHVHRISNRFGYVKTKNPDETEQALRKKLAKRHWIGYNELLVTFGQNHCAPISPRCSTCPVSRFCTRVGVTKSR
ncbi:endonuclease III [Candidatus Woesearchaeota archaeon]|nr:endonuclease III [Candidatus Woesearchaeota archaeon]